MLPMRRFLFALPALTVLAAAVATTDAQGVPFSQHGSVAQRVSHTLIEIGYNRPVARGRVLFGALVKWDSVWHPGADSATVIRFDKDVQVAGRRLPRGEYSLWVIPRQRAPWTLIFNAQARVFHSPYPGQPRTCSGSTSRRRPALTWKRWPGTSRSSAAIPRCSGCIGVRPSSPFTSGSPASRSVAAGHGGLRPSPRQAGVRLSRRADAPRQPAATVAGERPRPWVEAGDPPGPRVTGTRGT